ncbi:hypothetical protein GBZ48_35115, partial [Azospirillum melinis]
MSSQSEFTLIAQAGTNPGDAFVGALTDGAVRIGYLAVSYTHLTLPTHSEGGGMRGAVSSTMKRSCTPAPQ